MFLECCVNMLDVKQKGKKKNAKTVFSAARDSSCPMIRGFYILLAGIRKLDRHSRLFVDEFTQGEIWIFIFHASSSREAISIVASKQR